MKQLQMLCKMQDEIDKKSMMTKQTDEQSMGKNQGGPKSISWFGKSGSNQNITGLLDDSKSNLSLS